uniref:Uncharacterized protein n=1 Tax=uncultured marine virus TaxID=186617 RepID=A0A0F7L8X5_9VIRU|nr:hypothetical protein [uncultured marine virus]
MYIKSIELEETEINLITSEIVKELDKIVLLDSFDLEVITQINDQVTSYTLIKGKIIGDEPEIWYSKQFEMTFTDLHGYLIKCKDWEEKQYKELEKQFESKIMELI